LDAFDISMLADSESISMSMNEQSEAMKSLTLA
jgi:hypothetical protein